LQKVIEMMTQMMVKPSSWMSTGVVVSKVRDRYLFKFSEILQNRLDELNEMLKTSDLPADEQAELSGILELDRIFMLLNAKTVTCSNN